MKRGSGTYDRFVFAQHRNHRRATKMAVLHIGAEVAIKRRINYYTHSRILITLQHTVHTRNQRARGSTSARQCNGVTRSSAFGGLLAADASIANVHSTISSMQLFRKSITNEYTDIVR